MQIGSVVWFGSSYTHIHTHGIGLRRLLVLRVTLNTNLLCRFWYFWFTELSKSSAFK